MVMVPTLVFVLLWLLSQGVVINAITMAGLPDGATSEGVGGERQLVLAEIQSIAAGWIFGEPEDWKLIAAERYNALSYAASIMLVFGVCLLAIALALFSRLKVAAEFRARHGVETIVSGILIFCSVVAVFTTVGIIASLALEIAKNP